MRVSFNMLYDQSIRSMSNALGDIQRLTEQTATEKKINRPSDDPAGLARVLDLNSTLKDFEQYQGNMTTATGWLTLADDVLGQASDMVTRLKELCEQAATGTYDAEQRRMIAEEARQIYESLIGIANTDYAGDFIFAGSMTGASPYVLGLGTTVREGVEVLSVSGSAESTIYVEFADSGEVGVDTLNYRYTNDGGENWTEAVLAPGETVLDLGTAQVELLSGSTVTAVAEEGGSEGSAVWVRPAAYYQGDAQSGNEVLHDGSRAVTAEASGDFNSPVVVRIDSGGTLPGTIEYSYSQDNGATWVVEQSADGGVLPAPGGFLALEPAGAAVSEGEEFIIKPHTADLTVEIGPGSPVQINHVGLEVFGGLWTPPGGTYPEAGEGENLLESIGEFIGYLETNNQTGIGVALENIRSAQENLTLAMSVIGGRESRIEFSESQIELLSESLSQSKSGIEDADITWLTTEMSKAEYIYEAVLSTSSKIMGLSLLDYI